MNASLVVFDIPGTTVHDDDAVNVCLRWAFFKCGVVVSHREVESVLGDPEPVAIAKLLTHLRKVATRTNDPDVVEIDRRFQTILSSRYRDAADIEAVEEAADVFRELKAVGIRVALVASFRRVILDTLLARVGWREGNLIDATVASDEVLRGRPYPDAIERAMALTNVHDASVVATIGNTRADLLSGMAAGCKWVIGMTTGKRLREQLEPTPHTHLVDRLSEIPRLLAQLQPS